MSTRRRAGEPTGGIVRPARWVQPLPLFDARRPPAQAPRPMSVDERTRRWVAGQEAARQRADADPAMSLYLKLRAAGWSRDAAMAETKRRETHGKDE